MIKPKLPRVPSESVDSIDPSWFHALNNCLIYAMEYPRADGKTIYKDEGGTLRVRKNQSPPGSGGGGDAAAGVLTVGASGGYGSATWQPVADDLTPGGTAVPVVVLPLK